MSLLTAVRCRDRCSDLRATVRAGRPPQSVKQQLHRFWWTTTASAERLAVMPLELVGRRETAWCVILIDRKWWVGDRRREVLKEGAEKATLNVCVLVVPSREAKGAEDFRKLAFRCVIRWMCFHFSTTESFSASFFCKQHQHVCPS